MLPRLRTTLLIWTFPPSSHQRQKPLLSETALSVGEAAFCRNLYPKSNSVSRHSRSADGEIQTSSAKRQHPHHLTSISTRMLAKKTKVKLKPKSSRRDRARQPFWLHSSTATEPGLRKTCSPVGGIPTITGRKRCSVSSSKTCWLLTVHLPTLPT